MVSIYWLIALFSSTFYWIYHEIVKQRKANISELYLIIFYFASRLVLLSQLTSISKGITFNFFIDLLFLYIIRGWLKHNQEKIDVASGLALYISNPIVLVSIISDRPKRMICLCVGILILLLIAYIRKVQFTKETIRKLKFDILVISVSGYLYTLSRDVMKLNWEQCKMGDDKFPTLLVIATFGAIVSWISLAYTFWRKEKNLLKGESTIENEAQEECIEPISEIGEKNITGVTITRKDWILISILTVLSAILIFLRIGSTKAPETSYEFNYDKDGQSSLILEFGDYQEVSQLCVFLGNMEERRISISVWDEVNNEWKLINEQDTLNSVFCWNQVEINQKVRAIGIVELDGKGVFNEVVLLDSQGNKILPTNADKYPTLFDEQEKYPETSTYYYGTYFDEIYHARTAYESLHGLPIYEISHPPLGKDLMSLGIRIFGMTPFGWRFIVAVFGILLTPIIYLFALYLTKKTGYAVAGAILLNVDFMHFSLSRIGTIDTIVTCFIIASFFFMYGFIQKESSYCCMEYNHGMEGMKLQHQEMRWLFFSGVSIGCAIATKWTGIYAAVGLAVLLLSFLFHTYPKVEKQSEQWKHRKVLFFTCVVSFIIIPVIIYLLSYIPYTKTMNGSLLKIAIDNAKYILNYHENAFKAHRYSSKWYEWAWMKMPLIDSRNILSNGRLSIIATFGNPIIWWSGIVAIFDNIRLWAVKKNQNAKFLCIAFTVMFAPWIFIQRTTFIYQYYACSILLVLMLMNSISNIKKRRNIKLWSLVILASLVFVLFYPVISGYPVTESYIDHFLQWMSSWKFIDLR